MFKDTEKELKRIEEELLQEEQAIPTDTDELIAQLREELDGEAYIDDSQAYNADRVDVDPEELSQALEQPQKERLTGLVVAALLLTAGILGILAWWAVRLLG